MAANPRRTAPLYGTVHTSFFQYGELSDEAAEKVAKQADPLATPVIAPLVDKEGKPRTFAMGTVAGNQVPLPVGVAVHVPVRPAVSMPLESHDAPPLSAATTLQTNSDLRPGHNEPLSTNAMTTQTNVDASAQQRAHSDPKAPGLLAMAGSATRAVTRFVADGMKTAPPEVVDQRLAICNSCEYYQQSRCRLCGCFIALKAKMPRENCPIFKWPYS